MGFGCDHCREHDLPAEACCFCPDAEIAALKAEVARRAGGEPSEGEREARRQVAVAAFDIAAATIDKRDAEIARLREYERLHGVRSNEIGALRAEVTRIRVEADEAIVDRAVVRAENKRLKVALAAGPAALRKSAARKNPYPWSQPWYAYESAAVTVEVAQAAAMKEKP